MQGRVGRELASILDGDGVPVRHPVAEWLGILEGIEQGLRGGPTLKNEEREALERFVHAALRFMRPDGSAVFGEEGAPAGRSALIRRLAEQLDDSRTRGVADLLFPRRGNPGAGDAPPLPAFGCGDRPLAMLRADWSKTGDLLAIDHRDTKRGCQIELICGGRRLFGPSWQAEGATKPRDAVWKTGIWADAAEWGFSVGSQKVTRTAVSLRGRKMAILADQTSKVGGDRPMRIRLADGVKAEASPDRRLITIEKGGVSARIIPLGLSDTLHEPASGSLTIEGDEIVLTQRPEGPRGWMPLLVSWDKVRDRRLGTWKRVTVSEGGSACAPGEAFAARVSWGPGDALVVYRSLTAPKGRTFLGHQTTARFLVGQFNSTGDVVPFLKLE